MHDFAAILSSNDLVRTLMDSLPCGVTILDDHARIVAVNKTFEKIIDPSSRFKGKGAGESMGCIWTRDSKNGCGHEDACADCKMRRMVLSAVNGKQVVNQKVPLERFVENCAHKISLRLNIAPLTVENRRYAVMVILEAHPLTSALNAPPEKGFYNIVGKHPKIQAVFNSIRNVAASDAAVLIQGESGTGKELVAAAIHKESSRRERPFVPFNCGALPEGMVESELFGHVKGAFTGAIRDKKGRFALAQAGTLFLDEVGELPPAVQVKLLRVLQDGSFERVGDEKTNQADVRVLSATNKDLNREVTAGRFRRDLFYRLCVVPMTLPPLRDRKSDLPLLTDHFLAKYTDATDRVECSPEILKIFNAYSWPGNVRELQNMVQYALINCRGNRIEPPHLPPHLNDSIHSPVKKRHKLDPADVSAALARANGNKRDAARLLGVSRSTLYRFFDQQEK